MAVKAAPGVDPAALRRRVLAAAEGRYALSITTNRELRREVLRIFDRTFAVTRALEAIAVAVSILGIANALAAAAAFAYLLLAVINPQSFGWTVVVTIPGARLAAAALLVLAASLAAGIYPGRLAAAVDPAAALAEE